MEIRSHVEPSGAIFGFHLAVDTEEDGQPLWMALWLSLSQFACVQFMARRGV